MKRILFYFIIYALLISVVPALCCADAGELAWGMSGDEIVRIMGEPAQTCAPDGNEYQVLDYSDQPVIEYKGISELAGTLSLILKEDALVGRFYMLEDKTIQKYVLLGRSLEIQYGDPVNDVSDIADFIEIMEVSSGKSIDRKRLEEDVSQWIDAVMMKSWKTDAGYSIALLLMRNEGDIYTVLGFIQSSDQIPGSE